MKKYGLIGKKLGHSFSRAFFTNYFERESIDAVYENVPVASEDSLGSVLKQGYAGLNVTIPYKESVIPFLDDLDPTAHEVGAVNTLIQNDGRWIGHNTDIIGFRRSLKPFLTHMHERALILGTGGASKAVAFVLNEIGIDCIWISRNPQKGQFGYHEVNKHMLNACKLIINCTPLGMSPDSDSFPDIPYHHIGEDHLAVDLVYNPAETIFMKNARTFGAIAINGESMLREQAMEAWRIWNNE